MDKEKLFVSILILSAVLMLIGSVSTILGGISENTAVKIFGILIGGVFSVLSVFCAVFAIALRDEK